MRSLCKPPLCSGFLSLSVPKQERRLSTLCTPSCTHPWRTINVVHLPPSAQGKTINVVPIPSHSRKENYHRCAHSFPFPEVGLSLLCTLLSHTEVGLSPLCTHLSHMGAGLSPLCTFFSLFGSWEDINNCSFLSSGPGRTLITVLPLSLWVLGGH